MINSITYITQISGGETTDFLQRHHQTECAFWTAFECFYLLEVTLLRPDHHPQVGMLKM